MALQLFQRLRLSSPMQVVRRGDQKQCRVFQLTRHKSTVRQLSQTDRQIKPLCDQVNIAISNVQLHLYAWVALIIVRQQRRQAVVGIGGRDTHSHATGQIALLTPANAFGVIKQRERRTRLLKIDASGFSQPHPAGRAL